MESSLLPGVPAAFVLLYCSVAKIFAIQELLFSRILNLDYAKMYIVIQTVLLRSLISSLDFLPASLHSLQLPILHSECAGLMQELNLIHHLGRISCSLKARCH